MSDRKNERCNRLVSQDANSLPTDWQDKLPMTIYLHTVEDGDDDLVWHELHDCTCPVCFGPAEHRVASNGYEDIECMRGCGLVWLRGDPEEPDYFIDKRPDKGKPPCDRCKGLTVH